MRDALSLLLQLRGFSTAAFDSAEAFLHSDSLERPACVLADVRLPGMSGLELQRNLVKRHEALPFVVMTAHGGVATARTALRDGAVDFLEKPIDEQDLIEAITAALRSDHEQVEKARNRETMLGRMQRLTERELEVFERVTSGLHNREIAEEFGISQRTVEVAAGGLAAGLLLHLLLKGGSGGEGTSEIMEAVSLQGTARLSLGRTARKALSSILLNALGGSVGREGPIVQVSAAMVSRMTYRLRVPLERRRILIGCGVAAGMGAAYNAPIGAAVFVMEVVHGNFALEIFGPVVLAAVTSTMVSWGFFGSGPLYPVPAEHAPTLLSLPLFALLGALVAWAGLVMRGAIEFSEKAFGRLKLPIWARMAIGGATVGLVATWIPEVWGNGYDGVREVLSGSVAAKVLLPLVLAKILATAASLGSGGSGGQERAASSD